MNYEPQRFRAPDGTEMVVLKAQDYERLIDLADEGEDVIEALKTRARIEAGEGTIPGEVVRFMIVDGLSALAAWRKYRGLSQAALAKKAALSQVWVGRIESGGGFGSRETRRKLAAALDAPIWALEDDGDEATSAIADEASPIPPQQASLSDRILGLVRKRPGMTELEIARELLGPHAVQQNVNQDCRLLVGRRLIQRMGVGGRSDPYTYRATK